MVHTQQQSTQKPRIRTEHQIFGEQGHIPYSPAKARRLRRQSRALGTQAAPETTQCTRTREYKASHLQFLLGKALTCSACELQHHFSTSFYVCLVTRIPYLTHIAHILLVFSIHSPALQRNCNSTFYMFYAAAPNHKKGSN